MAMTGEHALDVLSHLRDWQTQGRATALIVVTQTEGGAVRAPGALLGVSDTDQIGYISGGCIDADVALQARQAIAEQSPRTLRYGAGSPFVDLPLPCGGAITVSIVPNPDPDVIDNAATLLSARQEIWMSVNDARQLSAGPASIATSNPSARFHYHPKLRLRIAGRGADALALAKLSHAAGFETVLQLTDDEDIEAARAAGLYKIEQLSSAADLLPSGDDAWTAFVLLFHDPDWEVPLLSQALDGPAFYIGAVGSARTHSKRMAALQAAGVPLQDANRIKGPIGLVPSLRDASLLAVSALSEIVASFSARTQPPAKQTALVLLAAGASHRYEAGDKLLAPFQGAPLLAKSAALRGHFPSKQAIAVIPEGSDARRDILEAEGWTVLENAQADLGQSTSLQTAMSYLRDQQSIDQIVVLLADMPNISWQQVEQTISVAERPDIHAVMTECNDVLSPPALFKKNLFEALSSVTGDRGAKSVFQSLAVGVETIKVSAAAAMDVDHVADLERLKELSDA